MQCQRSDRTYDLSQGKPQHLEENDQAAGRGHGGHGEQRVLELGATHRQRGLLSEPRTGSLENAAGRAGAGT